MKAHHAILLALAAMPMAQADSQPSPAAAPPVACDSHSPEYKAGVEALARFNEVQLAYVRLAASINNRAKMMLRKRGLLQAYARLDAACWELQRLRCPLDISEAAALSADFSACLDLPDELRADYERFVEAGGYGQFFPLMAARGGLSRPIGDVLYFDELATALATASPEVQADYDRRMEAIGLMQQLDAELRGLTREKLGERAATLESLQARVAALPLDTLLQPIDRDSRLQPENYLRFMANASWYSLLCQYQLLREDAIPSDKRLPAVLQTLEALFRGHGKDIPSAGELKDTCFGVPKERW